MRLYLTITPFNYNLLLINIAETEEDRKNLIESGFKFVEQVEGKSYYRKRKEYAYEKL